MQNDTHIENNILLSHLKSTFTNGLCQRFNTPMVTEPRSIKANARNTYSNCPLRNFPPNYSCGNNITSS
ncbi:MAG: hypothetical protein BECKG1743D_GA0114223_100048 [Candidatus Kentron sp. G]|nr:MAG: hypothetical protein BECKG1743F_GA0114225_1000216 [Candidatus Kentron sp. G]VFM95494.1 MAG: hypothetical protein BECKG1743E_GA0114224_1000510 [Candidatus Kentron sp. G]VFM97136.1 MAG: hypothetical protein BECKG1743D_GA0114223_100048 [Candidatus Kentron sp. G]